MYMHKYLEALDCEIKELVEHEACHLTYKGEKALHVLLENRKHVKAMMTEKGDMPMAGNPEKSSYFGGV